MTSVLDFLVALIDCVLSLSVEKLGFTVFFMLLMGTIFGCVSEWTDLPCLIYALLHLLIGVIIVGGLIAIWIV